MKKAPLIFALMFVAGIATAQKTKFGLRAGFTSAKLTATSGNVSLNTDNIQNVEFGVVGERTYSQFAVQAGLSYISKGGESTSPGPSTATTYSTIVSQLKFNYLELPINVLYNIPLKPGKVFFGGGPYLAYALSGTQTSNGTNYSNTGGVLATAHISENVKFGSGTNDVARFDYGLNALIGFRLNNGLELDLGYGLGLGNLNNDSSGSIKNTTLSAGLGYFFK